MSVESDFRHTNNQLYLSILNNEQDSYSPEEVSQYVQIYSGEQYVNEITKQNTLTLHNLKNCTVISNNEKDPLTNKLEEAILKKNPSCIDYGNNYTL
jgi:hypothetical protein